MPDSSTPYEVLGVTAAATMEELRRAYRRRLRETHPDTGGEAVEFHAVQVAWELIGTPEDRAAFDGSAAPTESPRAAGFASGSSAHSTRPTGAGTGASAPGGAPGNGSSSVPPWEQPSPGPRHADPEPTSRAYGHPGGWNREEYYALMREWVGRGAAFDNPYDAAMVRAAPREIRHLLADANAEEETARTLSRLGIAYTVWHDIDTESAGPGAEQKLDHVVLGPTGLFALLSEDWGGALQVRRGEIVSDMLAVGERPINSLSRRTRGLVRSARVKFTAIAVIVPDGTTAEPLAVVGKEKGVPAVVVQRSRLSELLEAGVPGTKRLSADELFATRERLQQAIRFI
jgi:curved DNA-binding protein CbpA